MIDQALLPLHTLVLLVIQHLNYISGSNNILDGLTIFMNYFTIIYTYGPLLSHMGPLIFRVQTVSVLRTLKYFDAMSSADTFKFFADQSIGR